MAWGSAPVHRGESGRQPQGPAWGLRAWKLGEWREVAIWRIRGPRDRLGREGMEDQEPKSRVVYSVNILSIGCWG